jgi:endonuclease/exonuclease/phosphatase family metal-dependent hydrolase
VETYRVLRPASFPYQDDYVFATDAVEVTSCVTVMDPVIRENRLSDHWPVVARLEIS